jgi:hypothetical protein
MLSAVAGTTAQRSKLRRDRRKKAAKDKRRKRRGKDITSSLTSSEVRSHGDGRVEKFNRKSVDARALSVALSNLFHSGGPSSRRKGSLQVHFHESSRSHGRRDHHHDRCEHCHRRHESPSKPSCSSSSSSSFESPERFPPRHGKSHHGKSRRR